MTMAALPRNVLRRLACVAALCCAGVAPTRAQAPAAPPAEARAPAECPPVAASLTPERVQEGIANARDHGFLWRITKGGHSSYLYGTVHVARLEWMFPGPTVLDALDGADTIALELDVLDQDIQRRLQAAMIAPRGFALPEALSQRLQRRVAAECLAPDALARMGPELQVASLAVLAARRDGLDPGYSVDLMLSIIGHGRKKSMISLETPEAQMQALQLPSAERRPPSSPPRWTTSRAGAAGR